MTHAVKKQGILDNPSLASLIILIYTAVTSTLMLTVATTANNLVQALFFAAFLGTVVLTFKSKANTWAKILSLAPALMVVMPIIGIRNEFLLEVVLQIVIYAALALGLNIVVGLAGLLDLGYVAFFAVGAYTWGIFGSAQIGRITGAGGEGLDGNWFWLFLALAVIVAIIVGVLIGLPVLKLKGDYLAIVTLGLGEVIRVFANNLTPVTNGPNGVLGINPPHIGWFHTLMSPIINRFELTEPQVFALFLYFLVLVVIAVIVLFNMRLDQSHIGRSWIAIREDEIAAQAMGVPLVRTKLIAFATGASFAGVMGAIFAIKQTAVSPEDFTFFQSIGVLVMVILGGMGSIPGVIVGAMAVTWLQLDFLKSLSEYLNTLPAFQNNGVFDPAKYEKLFFGLLLIFMMLFRPQGLLPAVRKHIKIPESATVNSGVSQQPVQEVK
ncbi:branched-chain amino acid ABC transporter permease [Deinococcus cellulosilyticus]|uniref:Branched-chain amino acid ABC transporter permease n=1 Tax=Deinococcus cellulosilyticus (strain DSM 18568 / NBRC 106333 / KACC 11606 / 5516J-15) TaxID=1223518 RepID=A0A511N6Q6_DEIC1|nr:branched-chain amino acid ABC transporter permease [Deinococcus cellulosilyticus]GEM48148.1 branched-chain amino acid ABC transporter permease [Deinococcus cellulosilyticus NBRC 106333 = KACC 11606]